MTDVLEKVSESPAALGTAVMAGLASMGLNKKKKTVPSTRMCKTELRQFDGVQRSEIYVGADGLVFDVSSAVELYGPRGPYAGLAGRDASRMLAKGIVDKLDDDGAPLSLPQRAALKAWVAALQTKYQVVAALETRFDVEFIDAAEKGSPEKSAAPEIVRLASSGADLKAVDLAGDGAIHIAARNGDLDCLRLLLKKSPDLLTAQGSKHRFPVHFAADSPKPDALKLLLAQGADPNAKANDDWTPLHAAAQAGHLANIRVLLNHCPPDAPSTAGVTPLLAAATFGHLDVCKALVAAGADPNRVGPRSLTPAQWAHNKGHADVVRFLTPSTSSRAEVPVVAFSSSAAAAPRPSY